MMVIVHVRRMKQSESNDMHTVFDPIFLMIMPINVI